MLSFASLKDDLCTFTNVVADAVPSRANDVVGGEETLVSDGVPVEAM